MTTNYTPGLPLVSLGRMLGPLQTGRALFYLVVKLFSCCVGASSDYVFMADVQALKRELLAVESGADLQTLAAADGGLTAGVVGGQPTDPHVRSLKDEPPKYIYYFISCQSHAVNREWGIDFIIHYSSR